MLANTVNGILSVLTVAAEIFSVVLIVVYVAKSKVLNSFLLKNAHFIAFVVALIATTGSLTYSEILGYEPCKFCWIQRIFMYPLVFIFGLSLFKKRDPNAIDYGLILSIPGMLVAGYHYLLQRGIITGSTCDALGYSVSCSKVFVTHFGYITIPMMAFSAFVLIILVALGYKKAFRS